MKINLKNKVLALAMCGLTLDSFAQQPLQKVTFVSFSKVNITDSFWKPKLDKVATTTLNTCIYQTEVKTPRIRNFEKVARKAGEKHEGIYYDDSDVFKAIEAIAYSLKNHPDASLEKKTDEWIDKIAAAQQPDGYLNTYYTLNGLEKRWTDMEKHEDYNAGHLIEGAVAYFNTTGKRKLLDVAIKFANHLDETFRLANRHWITGHQEVELALVKLYRTTNDERYLKLADWYLSERGHGYGKGVIWDNWKDPAYCQDKVPVKEQTEITGHAVRAMYLYTGAADVASITGDEGYIRSMKTVWDDVVHRNMYITGGIGSSGSNEGFSKDYDLPNEHAYCETCASVGMVFWNQRMNMLTGEGKYMDILERSLYNGALDGLSLSGDRFFYGNPLASSGNYQRSEWFGTACCPSNIARLIASLGDYIYSKSENGIWVNLFVGSNTIIPLKSGEVAVQLQTNYPWNGLVKLNVSPKKKSRFIVSFRIPGWVNEQSIAGDLYHYTEISKEKPVIKVNGKEIDYTVEKGYAKIDREWNAGDEVSVNLPMEIRKITARNEVKADNDRLAVQRGPLVYCVEGADNEGKVSNIILPEKTIFSPENQEVAGESVVALKASVPSLIISVDGQNVQTVNRNITAIPYYTWCNRGANQMQVWLPAKVRNVTINE
ncbi:hypothetical protein SAMN04515674_101238 [Pseudarcicella hirudinis]|uniref:DUF1680 family protein n=1 Tax=Pseudarcicella hirudinis TaxID=1079859 RepID=A0A1I5MCG9_9BACT|nr:hypothetical protein SAMN04515674_101238 [Pseudarcicella hirudinis]